VRFRCVVCSNNCTPPGKLRGFKLRDHTCPCGGRLARGTNPDGPWAHAVPLTLEQRAVTEERLAMKRSTSRPRIRGEASLALIALLAFGGPLVILFLAIGATLLRRAWRWRKKGIGHRPGCDCLACHTDRKAA
jgi:hypothetical protein